MMIAGSSEALDDCHDDMNTPSSPDRQMQQRANTTVHVCWHRSTSVGLKDHHVALLVSSIYLIIVDRT